MLLYIIYYKTSIATLKFRIKYMKKGTLIIFSTITLFWTAFGQASNKSYYVLQDKLDEGYYQLYSEDNNLRFTF